MIILCFQFLACKNNHFIPYKYNKVLKKYRKRLQKSFTGKRVSQNSGEKEIPTTSIMNVVGT